jgi:aminoglycoside phosphotransferase (APT) family kinase protein
MFYLKADLEVADEKLRELRRGAEAASWDRGRIAWLTRRTLGVSSVSVEPLPEQGTFHRVFRVKTRAASLIFRGTAGSAWYRDWLLHLGPWVSDHLRAAGLPAARVYHVDTSRALCEFDFEIQEDWSAPPLSRSHADEGRMALLLQDLGRLCARVHQIRLTGFGPLDVRPLLRAGEPVPVRGLHDAWREHLVQHLDRHVRKCVDLGALSLASADHAQQAIRSALPLLDDVSPRLLHGDLGSHNVLAGETGVLGLLDWEDCLAGDSVFDIAFWATFHPPHRYPFFLAGYQSVASLPADFNLRFWVYFLRIALAKTVLRSRFGYPDWPGSPASGRIQLALRELHQAT